MFLYNVKNLLSQEKELFKRAGIVKLGYHGAERSFCGGRTWYNFYYKGYSESIFAGYFTTCLGNTVLYTDGGQINNIQKVNNQ